MFNLAPQNKSIPNSDFEVVIYLLVIYLYKLFFSFFFIAINMQMLSLFEGPCCTNIDLKLNL